jgi:predicted RNA-binding protein with PIN domain
MCYGHHVKASWYIIDAYSLLYRANPGGFDGPVAIARARKKLVEQIASTVPSRNVRVSLVFDGQRASEDVSDFGGTIELIYTGRNQSADGYIEQWAASLREPGKAVVVSSDRAVVETVAAAGCQITTCRTFLEMMERVSKRSRRAQGTFQRKIKGPRLGDFFPDDL